MDFLSQSMRVRFLNRTSRLWRRYLDTWSLLPISRDIMVFLFSGLLALRRLRRLKWLLRQAGAPGESASSELSSIGAPALRPDGAGARSGPA